MKIRIFDMDRHRHARAGDARRLAVFTAEMSGVRFTGCTLIEHADGTRKAYLPRGYKSTNGVSFYDRALIDRFTDAACKAYESESKAEPEHAGLLRMLGAAERDSLEMAGI